jgi:hypothetical protein
MSSKTKDYLYYICGILLLLSAIFYMQKWNFVPYIYAIASAGIAVVLLTSPYKGENFRLKRLNMQQAIAALLLPVSSFLMFKGLNEWFVCLLVSAVLQLYIVFVRDYEEKKQKKEENGTD